MRFGGSVDERAPKQTPVADPPPLRIEYKIARLRLGMMLACLLGLASLAGSGGDGSRNVTRDLCLVVLGVVVLVVLR